MIFSNVIQFVEAVGRRQYYKYGELDQLTCIYTGPVYQALAFRPRVESPHPLYPLMFVTGSEITNREAGVAEVSVTYEGIIQTDGSGSYVTPPITSESPVQGSRDFVRPYMTPIGSPGVVLVPQPGTPVLSAQVAQLYNAGTQSVAIRYLGTQCSVRYQAYPRPGGLKYSHLGLSRVKMKIISETLGPVSIALNGTTQGSAASWFATAIPQEPALYATNLGFNIEQRGKWYNCTEVYGPTF